MTTRRAMFPVNYPAGSPVAWPSHVPLTFVEPWRAAIQRNHGRTIEQLARSGGLDVVELWLASRDLPPSRLADVTPEAAARWLIAELNKESP